MKSYRNTLYVSKTWNEAAIYIRDAMRKRFREHRTNSSYDYYILPNGKLDGPYKYTENYGRSTDKKIIGFYLNNLLHGIYKEQLSSSTLISTYNMGIKEGNHHG